MLMALVELVSVCCFCYCKIVQFWVFEKVDVKLFYSCVLAFLSPGHFGTPERCSC